VAQIEIGIEIGIAIGIEIGIGIGIGIESGRRFHRPAPTRLLPKVGQAACLSSPEKHRLAACAYFFTCSAEGPVNGVFLTGLTGLTGSFPESCYPVILSKNNLFDTDIDFDFDYPQWKSRSAPIRPIALISPIGPNKETAGQSTTSPCKRRHRAITPTAPPLRIFCSGYRCRPPHGCPNGRTMRSAALGIRPRRWYGHHFRPRRRRHVC